MPDTAMAQAQHTALSQHATHVLVLRTRRYVDGPRPSRSAPLVARTALRRGSPLLRGAYLASTKRLAADDARLADDDARPAGDRPSILSIRPHTAAPQISRLARDGRQLTAALEAGREAVLSVLPAPLLPV